MRTARALLWTWLLLAMGYFLWENTVARGFADWLLERQYDRLGAFRPTTTLLGLALVAGLPALALFLFYRHRHRRRHRDDLPDPVRFALLHLRLLIAVAALAGIGAIASLLLLLALPSATGPIQDVAGSDYAELPDGHTRLVGQGPGGPRIRYVVRLPWHEQVTWFAPVSGGEGRGTRLFVQLDATGAVPPSITGVTARNALPPSVRNLFMQLGIRAPGPHYVLFTQPSELTRPYYLAAVQFALVGLIALLCAGLQWRNRRRAERRIEELRRQETTDAEVEPLPA